MDNHLIQTGDIVKIQTRYWGYTFGVVVEDVYFGHAPAAGHYTVYSPRTGMLHQIPRYGNARKHSEGGQVAVDAAHAHYRRLLETEHPKAGWAERFASGWRAF